MVTRKTSEKKISTRKPIMVDAPATRASVKHFSSSTHHAFSYSFVAFLTVLAMLAVEAFFGFPSRWLHDDGMMMTADHGRGDDSVKACTREYMPVCGKNGKTYPNMCEMENAGADLDHKGECVKNAERMTEEATLSGEESVAVNPPLPETSIATPGENPTPTIDTSKGWTYVSKSSGYSLTVPRFAYYGSHRTTDGKSEIVAVDTTKKGSESSTAALVRATFTKTGNTPPSDAKQVLNVANGTISLSYSEPLSKQAKEIVDYIVASAK